MLIIPAIDLKDGKCVRLKQGRMEDDTVFSDDPVATAAHWVNEGPGLRMAACRRLERRLCRNANPQTSGRGDRTIST